MEQLFFHALYYDQPRDLHPDQAMAIHNAYDSWAEIKQTIPHWLQWNIAGSDYEPVQQGAEEYKLYNPGGKRLTSLYAVEVKPSELDRLEGCHKLFVQAAEDDPDGPVGEALTRVADLKARTAPSACRTRPVEDFGRVLEVLRLKAPPGLLNALCEAAEAVTLTSTQEKEYRAFCDQVVWTLSAGDEFTYAAHRASYA